MCHMSYSETMTKPPEIALATSTPAVPPARTFDVIVVGGGPAGMMAAGRAAELGQRVLLIEKNDTLGRKLLISGGGRCNVTNATFDTRLLLKQYGAAEQFLYSPFSQFDVKQTIHFFESRGMKTKVENENRVFPVSDSARSVWEVMKRYMETAGPASGTGGSVKVMMNTSVLGFVTEKNTTKGNISAIRIKPAKGGLATEITAKHYVLAAGGASRPETGSDGTAFKWLRDIGHNVTIPTPSLVPITVKDAWISRLAGLSLSGIKVTVLQGKPPGTDGKVDEKMIKKYEVRKNEVKNTKVLFTHVGLSGPTILNMSSDIRELLEHRYSEAKGGTPDNIFISLDLVPEADYGVLNKKLQDIFLANGKKKFKNCLGDLVPSTLQPIIFERLAELSADETNKIDPEKPVNLVSRDERLALMTLLKHFTLTVKGLLGFEKAIIADGGVDIREVDSATMKSRLYPNLSLIGDILDIERPSGGYSLQLCWTSGYVAGSNISK